MTERELEILGFTKEIGVDNESYADYYYYTYQITFGLSFITNESDEVKDGQWYVEFFDTQVPVRFHKFEQVQSLINTLTKALVNE
jgi:hypothetical protein